MERLKVGAIGFGLRGKSVLENVLVPIYESGKHVYKPRRPRKTLGYLRQKNNP